MKIKLNIDLSTPDKLFAAIEKETGEKLDPMDQALMCMLAITSSPEEVYVRVVHDCTNCPDQGKCENEEHWQKVPDVFRQAWND
jgi:hypothetical protein